MGAVRRDRRGITRVIRMRLTTRRSMRDRPPTIRPRIRWTDNHRRIRVRMRLARIRPTTRAVLTTAIRGTGHPRMITTRTLQMSTRTLRLRFRRGVLVRM